MSNIRRTAQGKSVDIDSIRMTNEETIAIGNMKTNARGDELGPGGKIIRKREDVMAEYYEDNPKAQPSQRQVTEVTPPPISQPKPKKTQEEK